MLKIATKLQIENLSYQSLENIKIFKDRGSVITVKNCIKYRKYKQIHIYSAELLELSQRVHKITDYAASDGGIMTLVRWDRALVGLTT